VSHSKKEMAEEVAQIKAAGGKIPHLAAILVGHDGGSETYVASKVKTCQEIGFKSTLILSHLLLHLSGNGLTIQQLIMLFFHIIDYLLLIKI